MKTETCGLCHQQATEDNPIFLEAVEGESKKKVCTRCYDDGHFIEWCFEEGARKKAMG